MPEAVGFTAFDDALATQCLAPFVFDVVPAGGGGFRDELHLADVVVAAFAVSGARGFVAARASGGFLRSRGRGIGAVLPVVFGIGLRDRRWRRNFTVHRDSDDPARRP